MAFDTLPLLKKDPSLIYSSGQNANRRSGPLGRRHPKIGNEITQLCRIEIRPFDALGSHSFGHRGAMIPHRSRDIHWRSGLPDCIETRAENTAHSANLMTLDAAF